MGDGTFSGKVLFLLNPETGKNKELHMPLINKYGFKEIETKTIEPEQFTTDAMKAALEEAAADDYSTCDSFLCVIMTHGNLEDKTHRRIIVGKTTETNVLYVDEILTLFDVEHLKGKPKIFMVSACAGGKTQQGVAKSGVTGTRLQANISSPQNTSTQMPNGTFPDDCCVIYTSPKGYEALDFVISAEVMKALAEYEERGNQSVSLLEILTVAIEKMTENAQTLFDKLPNDLKQVPSAFLEHSLTTDIHLNIKETTSAATSESPYSDEERDEGSVRKKQKLEERSYTWTQSKEIKGSCRIELFYFRYDEKNMPERDGKAIDVKEVECLLEHFERVKIQVNLGRGFSHHKHQNRTKKQVQTTLNRVAGEDNKGYDCFFFVFLCFGQGEEIFCQDGKKISTEDLMKPFKGKQSMLGKPKIFCFQACDLDKHKEGIGYRGPTDEREVTPIIPIEADFLTIHSNIPAMYKPTSTSYSSGERSSDASFLIQAFVKAFEETKEGPTHLLRLTTEINRKVKHYISGSENPVNKFNVPRVTSTLPKLLHFPPKE